MKKHTIQENQLLAAPAYVSWMSVVRCYMKCHRVLNTELRPLGISIPQHEILVAVHQKPDLTQRELCQKLLTVKSNISGLVRRLEQQGLLIRLQNQKDSREKHLHLTPQGNQIVHKAFAIQNKIIETMTGVLSQEEINTIHNIMSRVGSALDAY